jgi:hypothetical protein
VYYENYLGLTAMIYVKIFSKKKFERKIGLKKAAI